MTRDPLLHHFSMLLRRTLIFIVLSLAQSLALWLWLWPHFYDVSVLDAARFLGAAWPVTLDSFYSVQAAGMLWVGCADTAILYLLLGRWWWRRADVMHRRGSRFIDERGGE